MGYHFIQFFSSYRNPCCVLSTAILNCVTIVSVQEDSWPPICHIRKREFFFYHCLFYITSHFKGCMYFIHRKLLKDGSFSCIIQPNIANFVLLVIEQSPCPGEVNSPSQVAVRLQPPAQAAGEGRERQSEPASAAAAPALATCHSVSYTHLRAHET